jgi:hypothetical protein
MGRLDAGVPLVAVLCSLQQNRILKCWEYRPMWHSHQIFELTKCESSCWRSSAWRLVIIRQTIDQYDIWAMFSNMAQQIMPLNFRRTGYSRHCTRLAKGLFFTIFLGAQILVTADYILNSSLPLDDILSPININSWPRGFEVGLHIHFAPNGRKHWRHLWRGSCYAVYVCRPLSSDRTCIWKTEQQEYGWKT